MKITKHQNTSILPWQHDNSMLTNPGTFVGNDSIIEKTLKDNIDEFGGKLSAKDQQNNANSVVLDSKPTERESYYSPLRHTIVLNESRPLSTELGENDYVHENTHGMFGLWQRSPQSKKIKQILDIPMRTAKEIYPTLMEIRYRYNIDPNHKFNVEEIKQLKNLINSGNDSYQRDFINQFKTDSGLEKLTNLFNLVADSGQKSEKAVVYALPGGQIPEITPAVITQDSEFNKFLMTLPDNLRLTPEKDYHMYQYWKLNEKPKDFNEGIDRGVFTWDNSDKGYHAGSIAEDRETGIYYFMKPKHHPTVKYELDWYNKGLETLEGGEQHPLQGEDRNFWEDFRSKYQLDSTGVDYRYVPRKKLGGGTLPYYLKYFNYGKEK